MSLKLSIITVCFNAAGTIEKTIKSVLAQSYPNIEYVIVDGASTDGTLDIIEKYRSTVSKFVSAKDKGIYDAMNKALFLATGDVVYFLNADDNFCDANVCADVMKAFEEDDSRMVVYGNVVLLGAPQGFNAPPAHAFKKRSISEFLHNSFCHQAIFVKRTLFAHVGLFDLHYKYAADYDWLVKVFKYKPKGFHFIDRHITNFNYMGRTRLDAAVSQKELRDIQYKSFKSLEYGWYFTRYKVIRGIKKRVLREKW